VTPPPPPPDTGPPPPPPVDTGVPADAGTYPVDQGTQPKEDSGSQCDDSSCPIPWPDWGIITPEDSGSEPEDSDVSHSKDKGAPSSKDKGVSPGKNDAGDEELEIVGGGFDCSVGGSPGSGWPLLILFASFIFFRFRKKLIPFLFIPMLFYSADAHSKANIPPSKLELGPTPTLDYFHTLGATTLKEGKGILGVNYILSHKPMRIVRKSNGEEMTSIVDYRHTLEIYKSYGFTKHFQFGITLPVMLRQHASGLDYLGHSQSSAGDTGLGDLRLVPKVLFYSGKYVAVGMALPLSLPLNLNERLGFNYPILSPRALLEFKRGGDSISLNVGYRFNEDKSIKFQNQNVALDDEVLLSLGLKGNLIKGLEDGSYSADFVADIFSSFSIHELDKEEVPVELLLGFRGYLPYGINWNLGIGFGLTQGVGAPAYRLITGLGWSFDWPPKKKPVKRPPKVKPPKVVIPPEKPPVKKPKKVGLRLISPQPVLCPLNKDVPFKSSMENLRQVAELLKKEKDALLKISLGGNACNIYTNSYNIELSRRRVMFVRNYLVSTGVDERKVLVKWFGEESPAHSNEKEETRKLNRRVDSLIILKIE
jgi:outer membrane protein OmpA-like peptidoglycan-associated protein